MRSKVGHTTLVYVITHTPVYSAIICPYPNHCTLKMTDDTNGKSCTRTTWSTATSGSDKFKIGEVGGGACIKNVHVREALANFYSITYLE